MGEDFLFVFSVVSSFSLLRTHWLPSTHWRIMRAISCCPSCRLASFSGSDMKSSYEAAISFIMTDAPTAQCISWWA